MHIIAQFPSADDEEAYRASQDDNNGTREGGSVSFNHMIVDSKTGQLFVGAVNRLLQLNPDLSLRELVITGKDAHILLACTYMA